MRRRCKVLAAQTCQSPARSRQRQSASQDPRVLVAAAGAPLSLHLAKTPLRHAPGTFLESLPFPRAHIIPCRVSGHVVQRVLDRDVFAISTDDDTQLAFVVGFVLLGAPRDRDDVVVVCE